ncbi:MAG: glycine cleavage system protein R [Acidiferrobacterales bacterium]
MSHYLVISAVGQDRPGIVNQLSRAILDNGCNVEDSRMTVLGGEFALILMVSGGWDAIARLEDQTSSLQEDLGLAIVARRTEQRADTLGLVPYEIDVVSMDHPGIVHEVAEFFSNRKINIEEMNTSSYAAAHTGTPMFSLKMTIAAPADIPIAQLRDEFAEFCDDLNLDAALEPAAR